MASAFKHKKRSSRYNQFTNIIPVNKFATHANIVTNAKFFRNMRNAAAQPKEETDAVME